MNGTLTLSRFGPITKVQIELKKFNVFIGPQGAGKSSIAKIIALIHSLASDRIRSVRENGVKNAKAIDLREYLRNFEIENYLTDKTHIKFEGDEFVFDCTKSKMIFDLKADIPDNKSNTTAYYFPAERISLPMIGNSVFGLQFHDVTLPKYFLQFGKDFESARLKQKLFNIGTLGVEYKYENGRDLVVLKNGKQLELSQTSSAIQANLPLLLILQYMERHSIAVIEEPELNAFPDLQKEMIEYIIRQFKSIQHKSQYLLLTTHSPYVLSTLNNLIQANNAYKKNEEKKKEISKIIPEALWIDFNNVNVYYIDKGGAQNIMDKKNKLIGTHQIDKVSEKLGEAYEKLLEFKYPSE